MYKWMGTGASAFGLAGSACSPMPSAAPVAPMSQGAAPRALDETGTHGGVVVGNVTVMPAAEEPEKATTATTPTQSEAHVGLLGGTSAPRDPSAHAMKGDEKPAKDAADKTATGKPVEQKTIGEGGSAPGAATTNTLSAPLSADDVDKAIGPQLRALRACANVDSSVSVRLGIAPGGKVADATATRSTPDDARLRDCVEGSLRTLSFRATSPERGTALSFDLELKPLGSP